MEFIGGGIGKDNGQGETGFVPAPGARGISLRPPNGAPDEQGENGILGQVAAFAEQVVKLLDAGLREVREQPADERLKQAGGMLIRMGIGGSGKDHRHPGQDREPVSGENF